jgi:hypothetical protein
VSAALSGMGVYSWKAGHLQATVGSLRLVGLRPFTLHLCASVLHRLSMVVYNMPYPPSRMPAQVYDTIPEDELMSPTTRLKSRAHARGGGGGGGRGAPLGALASAVSQAAHAAQGSGEAGGPTSMSGAAGGGGGGGAASARSPYSDEAHRDNLEKSVTSASLTPRDKVDGMTT